MLVVEVDVVGAEPLQRSVDRAPDMLGRAVERAERRKVPGLRRRFDPPRELRPSPRADTSSDPSLRVFILLQWSRVVPIPPYDLRIAEQDPDGDDHRPAECDLDQADAQRDGEEALADQ
jgi:hypothetical protein